MVPLSNEDVCRVWEQGVSEHPVDRGISMLAASHTGLTREELSALSLGDCERRLAQLRRDLFGPLVRFADRCGACGQQVEFTVDLDRMELSEKTGAIDGVREWRHGDTEVRFRCPNTGDLRAAARCDGVDRARLLLLERCVVAACVEGRPVRACDLPAELTEVLAEHMSGCDPSAEILLLVRCSECGHEQARVLEFASLLWEELSSLARRLLAEVHALARSYGWTERDVLAMTATRRRMYLELLG